MTVERAWLPARSSAHALGSCPIDSPQFREIASAHMRRVPAVRLRALVAVLVALLVITAGTLIAIPVTRAGLQTGAPQVPASPAPTTSGAPLHFDTLPPGSRLPSGAQCAAWVKARPVPENREANRAANQTAGHRLGKNFFPANDDPRANSQLAPRVDGQFTGTTYEILRWAACKWGVDEDIVSAQAAAESWWQQSQMGDWGSDPKACPPGHGLGADGQDGRCPQSLGILQNRYRDERSAWPGAERSTAMNADVAYATWRSCFEGYERWLNTVDRGRQYRAGDASGCLGSWFAGRWYTPAAQSYIAKVQAYRDQEVWRRADFAQS